HLPALRLVDAHRRRRGAGETGVAALAGGGVEDERRLPRQVRRVDDVLPALAGDLELDQPRRLRRGRERHLDGVTVVLEGAVLRFPAGLRGGVERAARDGQVDDLTDDHARASRHRIHGRRGGNPHLALEGERVVTRRRRELPEHELRPGDGGAGAGGGGGGSLSRGRRPQGRGGRGGGGSLSRGRRRLVGVAHAVTVLVAADGDDVGDPEVEHEGFITHRIEEDVAREAEAGGAVAHAAVGSDGDHLAAPEGADAAHQHV